MTDSADEKSSSRRPDDDRRRAKDRKLDEVFGDVLPDTTSDERDPGTSRAGGEDWYHENRPPHHDR